MSVRQAVVLCFDDQGGRLEARNVLQCESRVVMSANFGRDDEGEDCYLVVHKRGCYLDIVLCYAGRGTTFLHGHLFHAGREFAVLEAATYRSLQLDARTCYDRVCAVRLASDFRPATSEPNP